MQPRHTALMALLLLATPCVAQERRVSASSPAGGDTAGYWQQRVRYQITAQLDESRSVARARARLTYVNNSPDTLRELFFHQYLNAFRPASAWSQADEREGRVRFQHLRDPDYGYERFMGPVQVAGRPVTVRYPGAPDSTVVWVGLPDPLLPGDSVDVTFEWEARPSTLPRRQGRRARTYDFAQWYPKVAVYDRGGWQPNALVPAGEFYGEFGEYDVTVILPVDQVIAATGVPVEGDPGWERVRRGGQVLPHRTAYGAVTPAEIQVPAGMRAVRFLARDVHHFAWSVSPDYRYEGGAYVRRAPAGTRFPAWDTVAVHVLYKPGDDSTWGRGVALERTRQALAWLERIYGPYAYPQVTNLHRLDPGGTEFPMMMMNGSPGLGLILHELGHIYSYGLLANNEWQNGWMDEGLTSYQTAWAQRDTPQERARRAIPPTPRPRGYRGFAERPSAAEAAAMERYRIDLLGRSEPIGTRADRFNEFAIYNQMIYARAQSMFSALRDVIGDSAFVRFLRLYYDRWAMRHVDETALRRAAEDASGQDLRWFFDQWVRRVGLVDYSLKGVRTRRDGDGWVTVARVVKRGEYFHPVRVGVRTDSGWTLVQIADPMIWSQTLTVRTTQEPREVKLDPLRFGDDWYAPNDRPHVPGPLQAFSGALRFDWPFLEQASAYRILNLVTPLAWYGSAGGIASGLRLRTNYQGWLNRVQLGVTVTARQPAEPPNPTWTGLHVRHVDPFDRLQLWATADDARLPWQPRPTIGLHLGAWAVDGVFKADVRKSWDVSRFLYANGPRRVLTASYSGAYPIVHSMLDPTRWSGLSTTELALGYFGSQPRPRDLIAVRSTAAVGYASGRPEPDFGADWYARLEAMLLGTASDTTSRYFARARFYGGWSRQAPVERAIHRGAENAIATFANHFYRPFDAPLARRGNHFLPVGGAGLRSNPFQVANRVLAVTAEQDFRIARLGPPARPLRLLAAAWAEGELLQKPAGTIGGGLVLRGHLFDRPVRMRLDLPLTADVLRRRARVPWTFSLGDLW